MPAFLTVKEAATLTGKSPSSIRRVIYPVVRDDKHPDRHHVQPSIEDVLQLRLKGDNFAWRLSEEMLRREIPVEPAAERDATPLSRIAPGEGRELLSMVQAELAIKNGQITQQGELIAKQMELISGLSERLREGNILIGSLQRQLQLTDGQKWQPTTSVPATKSASPPRERQNAKKVPPTPTKKAAPVPPKKKSLFARLFS